MTYDKLVTIEKINEDEQWKPFANIHCRINKTKGGESSSAGAQRFQATLTFEARYSKQLEQIRSNTQNYRLKYRNEVYNIVDYDDFIERHQTIKLTGVLI